MLKNCSLLGLEITKLYMAAALCLDRWEGEDRGRMRNGKEKEGLRMVKGYGCYILWKWIVPD